MPNHITNELNFEGSDEQILKLTRGVIGDNGYFDFDRILPLPRKIEKDGLSTFEVSSIWGTKWNAYDQACPIDLGSDSRNVIPRYRLCTLGRKPRHHTTRPKRLIKKALTKLCTDEGMQGFYFEFSTAWSAPYPVFAELSRRFPKVTIKIRYADEDIGYNCGELEFKGGELVYSSVSNDSSKDEDERAKWVKFALEVKYGEVDPVEHGYTADYKYEEETE